MIGCRPLSDEEIRLVTHAFGGPFEHRNRLFFVLGYTSGFRVSELLSLRVSDVWRNGRPLEKIRVQRRHMKRKIASRTAALAPIARKYLELWIGQMAMKLDAKAQKIRAATTTPATKTPALPRTTATTAVRKETSVDSARFFSADFEPQPHAAPYTKAAANQSLPGPPAPAPPDRPAPAAPPPLYSGVFLDPTAFLFPSRKSMKRPISRVQAYRIIADAYDACELCITNKGVHTLRKTYADRVFHAMGENIFKVQKALGHASPASTVAYLSFQEDELDQAVATIWSQPEETRL